MDGYTQIPIPRDEPATHGCTWCGATQLDPGFIEDSGQGSHGFARWIVGDLEKGIFGGASRFGRERIDITGRRCARCGHLEFFAN